MRIIKLLVTAILCIGLFASLFTVSAKEVEYAPYSGYEYDSDQESVAAPVSYVYNSLNTYKQFGLDKPLSEPTDIYWDGKTLYILDSGNSRIIKLDSEYKLKGVIEAVTDAAGTAYDFSGAKGMTVAKNGKIYVCDTNNYRVLVISPEGKVIDIFEKPETSLVGYDYTFDVVKVLINDQGNILVTAQSVNNGAFVFTPEGELVSFFGRNTVQRTVDVLLNYIRKQFLTREQIRKQQSYSPATISSFDMDEKGFIYTVARTGSAASDATIRKLNYNGTDILKTEGIISRYGDLESVRDIIKNNNYTSFSDVDIDDGDFINVLDEGRGKIFQYTQNGQLIAVYGGYGDQIGMFLKPIAIETIGERVLVLDFDQKGIVEFVPSDYLKALRKAFIDLDTSDPQKAIKLWNVVLKYNSNSQYPYYGLGMAYEKLGDYGEAMKYFKLASTLPEYSDAYREYRKQVVADNLLWIILIAVVAIVLIAVAVKALKKKLVKSSSGAFSALENKYAFPFYVLTHPSDGFQQFKYRPELPSYGIPLIIVVLFFFIKVWQFFGTGYVFNGNDASDYTILSTLIGSVILYVLFVIGNWAVCSLMDGNGKVKEICSVTAYALIPYILSMVINIIISNVLTLDEAMALTIVNVIGIVWTALVLLIGLSQIHQYYIGKTILTMLLSLFAMIIIAIIVFLLFSLMQQVIYFFSSIWSELQLRY